MNLSQHACRCGHDLQSPKVHLEPHYSLAGCLLLMLGATPNPVSAVYRCACCGAVLRKTRDAATLRQAAD